MKKVVMVAVLLLCCSLSVFAGGKKDTKARPGSGFPIPAFCVKAVTKPMDSVPVIGRTFGKAESFLFVKKED